MPEVGIGLFPDVGAGWLLPRRPGAVGMWLALTGTHLLAGDCLEAGLATHYVPSHSLTAARRAIAAAADEPNSRGTLEKWLRGHQTEAPPVAELVPDKRDRIDDLFSRDSIEAIVAGLEADDSDWAHEQLGRLSLAAPLSLRVAYRQMREGANMDSFTAELRQEYRLITRLITRHDFMEGVRARLVDKDNQPNWSPSTVSSVDNDTIDSLFLPLAAEDEWTPLPDHH
jgi:enoyl-CoA hydratase